MTSTTLERVDAGVLSVAYEASGPAAGHPVVLIHGFPYDVRAFDEVVPVLVARGHRVIVPYVRGYGPTRFLSADTLRAGQQGAIGDDLRQLLDALDIGHATLAGFDWGARAACVVAALWPERVRGLVTACGYQIQDIAAANRPASPEDERRYWYQYYFHTERGRAGLDLNRKALCRLLWNLWSPTWKFGDATYERTARSFDNPDFVDVSIHSYRHRYGNAPGDPAYADIEARLSARPTIATPTIAVHGVDDDVIPLRTSDEHERFFTGRYERRVLQGIGHDVPQEAPRDFAQAVLDVLDWSAAAAP